MVKRHVSIGIVASVILVAASITFAGASSSAEEEAIRETVELYFIGIMEYDADALRQAFLDDAVLFASLPRGLYRSPFEQWMRFTDGVAPPDTSEYRNEILSIDISGNAAVVKTDLDWPSIHYVDYLSLVKNVDGQWKIAAKIWHQEPSR